MTKNVLEITYEQYGSVEELSAEDRKLAEAAVQAITGSYAPYSKFNVGAAVRMSNGTIVTGANQENAAFGVSMCAERSALFAAGANYPDVAVNSVAIAARDASGLLAEPVSPCGVCRQAMVVAGGNIVCRIQDQRQPHTL